jgi:glycosyltransferase involved in cell wall biosynthesis
MKVLLCHNHYQQPGGEDQSFAAEADLLESRGHQVLRFTLHNDAVSGMSRWDIARRTLWNPDTYRRLRVLIRREGPAIVHCTNTFPLISPAACYAARAEGVPVVQALRNYRLLCPNALLLRGGRVCEACLGKAVPWPAVVHGCYRGDRAASAVVAGMLTTHRALRTWTRKVTLFFTLTEFARRKLVEGGLPAGRVAVKPNFIDPDPGPGDGRGVYAVFVGRLSPEKGVATLLAAWQRLPAAVPLKVIGDGPEAGLVRQAAARDRRIEWLGRVPPEEVLRVIGEAAVLVMPSIWYETFGRTIIEAFARGTPAVVSRLGAMAELVDEGRTGLLFEPGSPDDLAAKVGRLLADPARLAPMRREARREFERKYTAATNYELLLGLYERARALAG